MEAMKQAACGAIDDDSQALAELSHDIWSNPEIFYQEKHAHDVLTAFLEGRGFKVDRHFVLVRCVAFIGSLLCCEVTPGEVAQPDETLFTGSR